ncbi:hypothetical protein VTJ49DRAFT_5298 [Mycothermus thermophilus]|uniref:Extracellular membrane protein CFEM domain-containing protein n=1 Tax=Humicola insolens TaxID=85995 RepID=A0ABR3V413_HUMIN
MHLTPTHKTLLFLLPLSTGVIASQNPPESQNHARALNNRNVIDDIAGTFGNVPAMIRGLEGCVAGCARYAGEQMGCNGDLACLCGLSGSARASSSSSTNPSTTTTSNADASSIADSTDTPTSTAKRNSARATAGFSLSGSAQFQTGSDDDDDDNDSDDDDNGLSSLFTDTNNKKSDTPGQAWESETRTCYESSYGRYLNAPYGCMESDGEFPDEGKLVEICQRYQEMGEKEDEEEEKEEVEEALREKFGLDEEGAEDVAGVGGVTRKGKENAAGMPEAGEPAKAITRTQCPGTLWIPYVTNNGF